MIRRLWTLLFAKPASQLDRDAWNAALAKIDAFKAEYPHLYRSEDRKP